MKIHPKIITFLLFMQFLFSCNEPGDTHFIIRNVAASCGCLTPEWIKRTLKSSEKGAIKKVLIQFFPKLFAKPLQLITGWILLIS